MMALAWINPAAARLGALELLIPCRLERCILCGTSCTLNECACRRACHSLSGGHLVQGRRRTTMRACTAAVRKILLGWLLMGICAPGWARFEPVSCKNSFTEQQEIAGGAKLAAQVFQQMPVLPDSAPVS